MNNLNNNDDKIENIYIPTDLRDAKNEEFISNSEEKALAKDNLNDYFQTENIWAEIWEEISNIKFPEEENSNSNDYWIRMYDKN